MSEKRYPDPSKYEKGFIGPYEPMDIRWWNQYERYRDSKSPHYGHMLPEAEMYGGGGEMSEDYLWDMQLYASGGTIRPWERERQIGSDCPLLSVALRATWDNSIKRAVEENERIRNERNKK